MRTTHSLSLRFLFSVLAATALLPSPASAADDMGSRLKGVSQSFGDGAGKTDVMADSAEYNFDSEWTTFSGNVAIRHKGFELRADRVRYNAKTGDAQAFGHVALVGDDGTLWTGDALDVNLVERAGRAETIDLYTQPFRVIADSGLLTGAAAHGGVYDVEHAILTTCTNEPGSFHWCIEAERARIRPEDDVTAWRVVPKIFGIPFFYIPYYWKDLERHYGFRFQPGYRHSWGVFLLCSYKLPLMRDKANDAYIDNYVYLDWRSERGIAVGDRIQWEFGDETAIESKGYLTGYYMPEDDDIPEVLDLPEGDPRYRVRFRHMWNATDRDQVLMSALYVSDVRVQKDFFRKEYREMTEPDNYATYTHYGDEWSAGLTARARLNDWYDQIERLPEAWFSLSSSELGESGVYLDNESSVVALARKFAEYGEGAYRRRSTNSIPKEYDSVRADSRFELTYPGKYFGFLSVVPRVAYRGTYFEKTLKKVERTTLYTSVSTNSFGHVDRTTYPTNYVRYDDDGAGYRSVFEVGAEVSARAYGYWWAEDGLLEWRHVVEPYLNYTYIPEPNILPDEVYRFDAVDSIYKKDSVRLGLRQRWQTHDPETDYIREPVYLDVYADFNIETDETRSEENVADFGWDARYRPAVWMEAISRGFYNNNYSGLQSTEFTVSAWHEVFKCDATYYFLRDFWSDSKNSYFDGGVSWFLNERWGVNGFVRYEFETSQVEEVGGWIQHAWDCFVLRLIGSVEPSYTNEFGLEEETDWHVTITGWLTDFVPNSILEENAR